MIFYKNKTLNTNHNFYLSNEEHQKIKSDYYLKPDFDLVVNEFINIKKGGTKIANINNYYFKDLYSKVVLSNSKWSVADVFDYKPLLEYFYAKTKLNDKVFPKNKSVLSNIETSIRLGGKGVAKKPTNFKLKTVNEILQKYNINNNYYDMSCGWGVRLLGALNNDINYFGNDPNELLVEQLNKLVADYSSIVPLISNVDIRTTGSEIFIPEWENLMGVSFSSPPYYNLEKYEDNKNQSIQKFSSYAEWLKGYYEKTMSNTYKYLIDGGHMLINIKDFDVYDLEQQTLLLAEKVGFNFVGYETLENANRTKSNGDFNESNEKIFVFYKKPKI
jgi:hypothetical protein